MNIVARSSLFAAVFAVVSATSLAVPAAHADDMRLTGAGGTFPFPIYSAWFKQFSDKTPASKLTIKVLAVALEFRPLSIIRLISVLATRR